MLPQNGVSIVVIKISDRYNKYMIKHVRKEANVTDLTGKIVIVQAEDGITYTGKLIEIGEEEVHLESDMGWVMIPVERIASITEKKD